MHPGFLRDDLVPRAVGDGLRVVRSSAIPDASHIVSGYDLDQTTGFYVADFDESAVEKKDVWRVPGDAFCRPLPFDCTHTATWVSVFVDV